MPAPNLRRWALIALALATAGGARAEGGKDLQFSAAVSQQHDSNLFRLSSAANTRALIGRNSAAETIRTSSLGLKYNKDYSLQNLQLDLNLVNYQYKNFSYLGFSAVNYNAAWRWSFTPHLRGNLTSSRGESLNSFVDFQGFNVRNERVDTNTRLDAVYDVDATWRLLGGITQSARKNALLIVQESDYRQTAADVGLGYVLASGSAAYYTLRSTDGSYINRAVSLPLLYDNGFTQTDNEIRLVWAISRSASAEFRAAHRSRSHPSFPQRDFGGTTGSANLNWSLSPKTTLTGGWTRDLGAYQTNDFNFVQTDRFYFGPVWQVSPKATVRMQLAHAMRDFRGTPTGALAAPRRETTNDASVAIDWQPYTYLTLSAALQNARRSASTAGLDYNSNVFSLSAQFSF